MKRHFEGPFFTPKPTRAPNDAQLGGTGDLSGEILALLGHNGAGKWGALGLFVLVVAWGGGESNVKIFSVDHMISTKILLCRWCRYSIKLG